MLFLTEDVLKENFLTVQDTIVSMDSMLKERILSIADIFTLVGASLIDKPALLVSDVLGLSDDSLSDKEFSVEDYIKLIDNIIQKIEGVGWSGIISGIYLPKKIMGIIREKIKKVSGVSDGS